MKRSAAPSRLKHANKRFRPPFLTSQTGTRTSFASKNNSEGCHWSSPSSSQKETTVNASKHSTSTSSKFCHNGNEKDGVCAVDLIAHTDSSKSNIPQSTILQSKDITTIKVNKEPIFNTNISPQQTTKNFTVNIAAENQVHGLSQNSDSQELDRLLEISPVQVMQVKMERENSEKNTVKAKSTNQFRAPLSSQQNNLMSQEGKQVKSCYYNVMYCKISNKKHKTWEGDGVLITTGRSAILKDLEGKDVSRGSGYKSSELETLQEGQSLRVGGKELEIMGTISADDFSRGRCFQVAQPIQQQTSVSPKKRNIVPSKPFVKPQLNATITGSCTRQVIVQPKFDPLAPDAVVMPRPSAAHQFQHNRSGLPVVDVVVDPHIAYQLRPHQKEGIRFMYQCVMGMRDYPGQGAILADEMGLGKTLQCIALIWTLLKQGPYGGKPIIKRAIVITPGSVVKNWCAEFRKWLGKERLSVYAVSQENKVKDFVNTLVHPVLIISYEMLVRHIEHIQQLKLDLIVCDEGHRLKNSNIKTAALINNLPARRRIVLSGTPVQNDLQEFYSLVDFCNPGILGTSAAFHNIYESPIIASQQPSASHAEMELGATRSEELAQLTKQFILRRTQQVNNQYLPPKIEHVVFCQPSPLQLTLYKHMLASRAVRKCLAEWSETSSHLVCIGALKKLCNEPCLIYQSCVEAEEQSDNQDSVYSGLLSSYPDDYYTTHCNSEDSGKMAVLMNLLQNMTTTGERVVVVSNYTQTLDVLETRMKENNYATLRLDGQTPTDKRQDIVNRFNAKHSNCFVFLLSSKAGGIGLNLIGASRIVLYDIDWNPATDLQAMARVWRDGQQKTVYIYRLITTGTIEEKIFQRQLIKQALSGAVVDSKIGSNVEFSREDLKDIFSLHEGTCSSTHDLLQCNCVQGEPRTTVDRPEVVRQCQLGAIQQKSKHVGMEDLFRWQHLTIPEKEDLLYSSRRWITLILRNKLNTT